jgi:predicted transcriptional regulator
MAMRPAMCYRVLVITLKINIFGKKMKQKIDVFNAISSLMLKNISNENFSSAVLLHCKMITNEFSKKKIFYKYIFKNKRFLISKIIVSNSFTLEDSSLSKVKSDCFKIGMANASTITSFFSFMVASGRVKITNNIFDKRTITYKMTEKGYLDAISLVNTITPSLCTINKEFDPHLKIEDIDVFFNKYSHIHKSGIFLTDLVRESRIFIEHDAGHIIMVRLYIYSKLSSEKEKKMALKSLHKDCGVSFSHIRKILSNAEKNGLISFSSGLNLIEVNNEFEEMFFSYMAYYISFIEYAAIEP